MKLKKILLFLIFYSTPLFLLDLYANPERSKESRMVYLIGLIVLGAIMSFINTWLSKKFPYKSSYRPKDQA